MPTIMTHAVIPVGLALAAGRELVPKRLLIVGAALAMAPDLDVLGLRWGGVTRTRGGTEAHRIPWCSHSSSR